MRRQEELPHGQLLYGVTDVTWKVDQERWGFWKLCLASKHVDASGFPQTTPVEIAVGRLAKESSDALTALLAATTKWYVTHGVSLPDHLHHCLFDDTSALLPLGEGFSY